jgi:hypothetical protein
MIKVSNKMYISSKTDRLGGGEESNSSHGSSIQNSCPFLAYTNELADSGQCMVGQQTFMQANK